VFCLAYSLCCQNSLLVAVNSTEQGWRSVLCFSFYHFCSVIRYGFDSFGCGPKIKMLFICVTWFLLNPATLTSCTTLKGIMLCNVSTCISSQVMCYRILSSTWKDACPKLSFNIMILFVCLFVFRVASGRPRDYFRCKKLG